MQSSARDMRRLAGDLHELERKLRSGGGPKKIEKQHNEGKLTARERIDHLIDRGTMFLEIGLLIAYDKYDGQAPGAGVVTGLAKIEGRPAVIVANDATVKAGAWWPETITKILRAQEIAMRNRVPIVYLVDSAGVNLPLQDGIFPGQYGAARIFYYNSLMRRRLHIPQIAAVMGPCIAGGAYLPALSDVIIMVEKASFMGLGGPNLVKGAVGQVTNAETLGGAAMHTSISGVAHYRAENDTACLEIIRQQFRQMPNTITPPKGNPPRLDPAGLYDALPADHRLPYQMEDVLGRILDTGDFLEFQPDYAPEFLCAAAQLNGRRIGVIANRRGFMKTPAGPRVGGIVYTESARKVAYFVENAERHRLPLLYVQDVSGFMVGVEAETAGIIRAGAEMVEAMACATVPKIVLTVNHASGAGYYAMAGQGFDPNFTFSWPTARIGVMEGDSAVQAIFGPDLDKLKNSGQPVPKELDTKIAKTRGDYERWLDAKYAAARGHCDAVIDPIETRPVLDFAFEVACANARTEHLPLEVMGLENAWEKSSASHDSVTR
ncbi:MAG: acyl-CoA carboxylase subunit beta [Acidobacteriaceae bacterium]|nr:acyl-CoA carboxylase subunit beta [Acidobacteriaceae bacterium]MBV9780720.1 acyl-CoA carboxylase subunit beta [Acidobacteriaceae bacterium]